ncbi:MAG TPA: 4'-phosphopantetheinyl transferase superfamily protein [Terriglobia bacterium]|nr:4'-phosphopantetheinyl transferase superfamily protein [Terriglobia bacterium]
MLALTAMQVRGYTENHGRICEPQQLDAWLLSTVVLPAEREIYEDVLSATERQVAARFHFDADRERSIVARGGLRRILSAYCGVSPQALTFRTDTYGKPSLSGIPSAPQFNVSHSGDCVLIGVSLGPCGVDVERSHTRLSEHSIAERFFCPREVKWLRRNQNGFLRLWTMKESVIKAVGRGLSIPLSDVDVTDIAEGNASTITLETPGLEKQTLWLKELNAAKDYAAAISMVGSEGAVNFCP